MTLESVAQISERPLATCRPWERDRPAHPAIAVESAGEPRPRSGTRPGDPAARFELPSTASCMVMGLSDHRRDHFIETSSRSPLLRLKPNLTGAIRRSLPELAFPTSTCQLHDELDGSLFLAEAISGRVSRAPSAYPFGNLGFYGPRAIGRRRERGVACNY